jgi:hypothetical protein
MHRIIPQLKEARICLVLAGDLVPVLAPAYVQVLAGALVLLVLLSSTGCGSKPKDVTNDPAFGNFASIVGPWKTKVPLRLVEIEKKLYLVYGDQFIPQSHDLVLLPAGTDIRIERLIFRETFEVDFLDVMGSLVTGPYSGKTVNVDSRLFTRMRDPTGGESTPTQYYSTWHGPKDKKPDWAAAPDKLAR